MSVLSTKECPASTVRVCTTRSTGDTDTRCDHESGVDHVDRAESVPRDVVAHGPPRKCTRETWRTTARRESGPERRGGPRPDAKVAWTMARRA
jgi:hypothetical protein